MTRKVRSSHPSATGDHKWRAVKAKHKAICRASNALCWRCVARGDVEMAKIDYSAPPLSPRGFESDHFKSVATHPHLALVLENLRPCHSRCNRMANQHSQSQPAFANPIGVQREWEVEVPDW